MKTYLKPLLEIIPLNVCDVITGSGDYDPNEVNSLKGTNFIDGGKLFN